MQEFRCFHCFKLLGKIKGEAQIKCPRCKAINNYPNQMGLNVIVGKGGTLVKAEADKESQWPVNL